METGRREEKDGFIHPESESVLEKWKPTDNLGNIHNIYTCKPKIHMGKVAIFASVHICKEQILLI